MRPFNGSARHTADSRESKLIPPFIRALPILNGAYATPERLVARFCAPDDLGNHLFLLFDLFIYTVIIDLLYSLIPCFSIDFFFIKYLYLFPANYCQAENYKSKFLSVAKAARPWLDHNNRRITGLVNFFRIGRRSDERRTLRRTR